MAVKITPRAEHHFRLHGWSDEDIDYIRNNANGIHDEDAWAMPYVYVDSDTVWLYPVSESDVFPKSLWKKIREYLQTNQNVVVPMSRNHDSVSKAAKRYNGYLQDNLLYIFRNELPNIKLCDGDDKCSVSRNTHELTMLQ